MSNLREYKSGGVKGRGELHFKKGKEDTYYGTFYDGMPHSEIMLILKFAIGEGYDSLIIHDAKGDIRVKSKSSRG